MIAVRRRERSYTKITRQSCENVSRVRERKRNDSRSSRCTPQRLLPGRLSSDGGKHGRVAALTPVTARRAVQDGRKSVLTMVTSMANNNTGKRGLQTAVSPSRGRGITISAGIRHQLASQHLPTSTNNAEASDGSNTTVETNRTKRKTSRHSENRTSAGTGAQRTLSVTVDSDVTSISARPAAEGSSYSDQEENIDADPETEELAKLRCPSERTEVIAERETRRRQRRCADYPGFAFGSSIFGSDTIMKFNIIRNELQNIKNTQLKRVSTYRFPMNKKKVANVTDQLFRCLSLQCLSMIWSRMAY